MLLKTSELKEVCAIILTAVDSNSQFKITETLEIVAENHKLYLNVTNKEYYVRVSLNIDSDEKFRAVIKAQLFLNLISKTTVDQLELNVNDSYLELIGNGKYKIPLIFEGDTLIKLPEINIENITSSFDISSEILHSIALYNSKAINKDEVVKSVQKMYYLDDKGCITFTNGACVNNFNLSNKIKVLLSDKIVKLFKLFKDSSISLSLGYDPISEDIIQTKIKLESSNICLTAILSCDDSLLSSVPAEAIRNRADKVYNYSVVLDRSELLGAINRLILFEDKNSRGYFSKLIFNGESVAVHDSSNENEEVIFYENVVDTLLNESYEAVIDLFDLKIIIDSFKDKFINIKFGDHEAIVIARNNVFNIIPECKCN